MIGSSSPILYYLHFLDLVGCSNCQQDVIFNLLMTWEMTLRAVCQQYVQQLFTQHPWCQRLHLHVFLITTL